jgi:5'-nucleotidase
MVVTAASLLLAPYAVIKSSKSSLRKLVLASIVPEFTNFKSSSPPGVLRMKDIMNCFPFEDPCVVIKVTGKQLLDSLENSVSTYPALEGRFPQVSNIEFEFDSNKSPYSRVQYVKIGNALLNLEKLYVLVTRGYMARGKDGFVSLLVKSEGGQAEEIVSEENGILINMILRQYFISLKIINQWGMWCGALDRHWKGVHSSLHETHPIVEPQKPKTAAKYIATFDGPLDENEDHASLNDQDYAKTSREKQERELSLIRKVARKWRRLAGLSGQAECCDKMAAAEFIVEWTKVRSLQIKGIINYLLVQAIAPRVEGRILMTSLTPVAAKT